MSHFHLINNFSTFIIKLRRIWLSQNPISRYILYNLSTTINAIEKKKTSYATLPTVRHVKTVIENTIFDESSDMSCYEIRRIKNLKQSKKYTDQHIRINYVITNA
jgi:hypothetical protein